ncbi:MAG: endopeptidase La [Deltaproteobacteria bacterium]|nr:endopeptidase La [Deltaproteobacteria bacterium]MBW2414699.1 endopeptidase La [Deltaproteobacteria bacterium]
MILPLFVGREVSIKAIETAAEGDRLLALVTQRDPDVDDPTPEDMYAIGTVGMIMRMMRLPDGRLKVLVQGLSKVRVAEYRKTEPFIEVQVEPLEVEDPQWSVETEALVRSVREKIEELLPLRHLPPEILSVTASVDDPGRLADLVSSNLRLRVDEAQEILEIVDPIRRLRKIDSLLRRELAVSSMQAEIQSNVRDEMTRSQREHFLREQLRAIQQELGETDERASEIEDLRERIAKAGMNEEARTEADRQLERLERMHPDSSETHVVRTYLEWMVELPWSCTSDDNLDLQHARDVLQRDHAYLHKVKERIIEFLAVHKLRGRVSGKSPILCLVGPPGVGKTSLGRSLAQAMGREFVRMSLGGMRDEAEIRGHRRTYVGAMPGRIVQGMKQAGSANPVFMLDEIDKLGADYRGDPAAAMLEVLDPEQNCQFRDHYLNVPYDLSQVLFVATANLIDPIPPALLDRMEVIRLPGYTPEEKEVIGRRFLVPRQLEECGLTAEAVTVSRSAIRTIITGYTLEAGVRSLEREIGRLFRKVARRFAEGEADSASISLRNLKSYLGAPPVQDEAIPREDEAGIARGLAWTQAGGEVLIVEATQVRGRGLTLTGQLGDVMKESGQAAHSYVRWRAAQFGIADALTRNEIHVHVPAGATPKDGPSAGVTMATAIVSLLTDIPIRADVAMTGEITLRGRVLPVGGVREKALAALRRGINQVILPASNKHDLDEIPPELARRIKFHFVHTMDEVLALALTEPLSPELRSSAIKKAAATRQVRS